MEFEFSYVSPQLLPRCKKILRNFFGSNYYGANDKFMDWQYRGPFSTKMVGDCNYSILVAIRDGDILALDAFLPWVTYCKGKPIQTVWDIEWINASKLRGMGRTLVTELRKRTQIYMGYGVNSYSRSSFTKMGFSICDEIERMVAILDPDECAAIFPVQNSMESISFLHESAIPRIRSPYKSIDNPTNIKDTYWHSNLSREWNISYKGPEYIKWRFYNHPFIKYHVVASDDAAERGLAVVRVEQIKGVDSNVCRIVDFLPTQGREIELLDCVLSYAMDAKCIMADFFCSSKEAANELIPIYFLPLENHRSYDFPMLFQPIEIRERKSINMVLDVDPEFSQLDFNNVITTKADGDQDVFVNDDYETVSI